MTRSEKINLSKLIASDQNSGSKSFQRAVKALCCDPQKRKETEQSVGVSYKQLRATTDTEKCKIFKTPLPDTIKDHKYES